VRRRGLDGEGQRDKQEGNKRKTGDKRQEKRDKRRVMQTVKVLLKGGCRLEKEGEGRK
jgi:hypothetical protein